MELLRTLGAFIVVIGVLVIIHELGHYLVARWCGVKVLRFSVGLGKVIWSRRFGPDQTEWAVSLVPLGGYVKMLDARESDAGELSEADAAREFTRQPVGKRIAIVAAGPLANFLLAIALFAALYTYGIPEPVSQVRVAQGGLAEIAGMKSGDTVTAVNGESVSAWSEMRWKLLQSTVAGQSARITLVRLDSRGDRLSSEVTLPLGGIAADDLDSHLLDRLGLDLARPPAILGELVPGGPAERAGLQPGDQILRIDGEPVPDGVAFVERLQAAPGKLLQLEGLRSGQPFSVSVTPQPERVGERTVGRIRAQVDMSAAMTVVQASPLEAVARAIRKTWDTSVMTVSMLGKMLIGEASLKNITGPITIADYAGQTARIGLISFLSFMAFISISLGVMNLLPIPVLDGGHLLYYSLELFSGRPVSERVGALAQRAGIGLLVVLMAVAMFNDIARLVW
ncbi:MAG: RIP metalloprotease RseP [Oxalobacteraceae bacterium]|nr:RIP metalloprotease RseP [Oxalobacteraceae bacterium]